VAIVKSLTYEYRTLLDGIEDAKAERTASEILALLAPLTKNWTTETNSAWTCRAYLATKMILNATVLVNGLNFAAGSGMRIANPYLEYYAALCAMRAVVFTLPTQEWSDGSLMAISHSKAINVSFDWLSKLDKGVLPRNHGRL
jgi:hypothetical protein